MPIEPLDELFARRLQEEMDERKLSDNALAKLAGVGQRSVSRILLPVNNPQRQVPRLGLVGKLAGALDLPAWYLMMEADEARHEVIRPPKTPGKLPGYAKALTQKSESSVDREIPTGKTQQVRKK